MSLALISGQLKSVALASTTKLMSLALAMKTKSLACGTVDRELNFALNI